MRRFIRVLFWLVFLGIVFATLSPIELRPESGFSPSIERLTAFTLLGGLGMLAFPRHRTAWIVALVIAAGLLEASQALVPTRHGRWADFAVKAAGVLLGSAIAMIGDWLCGHAMSGGHMPVAGHMPVTGRKPVTGRTIGSSKAPGG